MCHSRPALFCLMVFGLFAVPAIAAAEEVDNPEYLSWSGCKPGSSVSTTVTTNIPWAKNPKDQNTTKTITVTLVSIDKDKAVVSTDGHEETISAKLNPPDPDKVPKPVGEEDVTINGKTYHCKIYERKSSNGNALMTFDDKTWTCKDMPGNFVKSHFEHTYSKGTSTTDTIVVALKQK